MADRADFYFRQRVTEAELDLAFSLLEKADRDLATDLGVHGIVSGGQPAPHAPVPNLSIDLMAPARAYDNLGQRIAFGTGQTVDCSVDLSGIPTDVTSATQERWLGVFLRFKRQLSDARTDGNSQLIYFRRDESFELVVRQGAPGPTGGAAKVALQAEELLLCDVKRRYGQTQVISSDIDVSRRQVFIFADAKALSVTTGLWKVLDPAADTVQASLDEVDAELDGHFSGATRRHAAGAIDFTPRGFVGSTNVQAAVAELVDDVSAVTTGAAGAGKVGAASIAGTPKALSAGSIESQLSALLSYLNGHLGATSGAHAASAISATPSGFLANTNVQGLLTELVSALTSSTSGTPGSMRVGADAATGSPNSLATGSVKTQLAALLGFINGHIVGAAAHAGTAITATPINFITSTTIQQQIIDLITALGSSTSGASGATRVGAEMVSGSPNSLSTGTARSQLTTLLTALNAHQNAATGAHAASATSVLDSAGMLNAVNAETALAEILSSLSGDHFRTNESYGGQHRTIRQPYLANGSRSLLWQANGAGYSMSELRVYQDSDSIWFCVGVNWDGTNWVPINAGYSCAALRIGRNNFEIVWAQAGSGSFTTWPKSWNLSLGGTNDSGFMMRTGMKETGRCGLKICNPTAATASVTGCVVVNFRNRFPTTPSSVTLQAYRYNISVAVEDSLSEGFALTATVSLAAGVIGVWNGHYTAIA